MATSLVSRRVLHAVGCLRTNMRELLAVKQPALPQRARATDEPDLLRCSTQQTAEASPEASASELHGLRPCCAWNWSSQGAIWALTALYWLSTYL